jgi:DNA-binding transcriptional MerR regulator
MASSPLQIGQVARKTGLSVDAIRFYEKSGLLPQPVRSNGGYRLYHQQQVADLEFIQQAQQLGFSLHEICELLTIQRHPQQACVHVRDLIAQKLAVVRSKIEELQTLEAGLSGALKKCSKALRRPAKEQNCPVLEDITASHPRSKQ